MLVDRVFNSVVASKHKLRDNIYRGGFQRDIWYNKKSLRGRKMVYYYGAALWEMSQREKGHMYFITVTTRQYVKDHFPIQCIHYGNDVEFVSNGSDRYETFVNPETNRSYTKDVNACYIRQNKSDQFYYEANKSFLRGKGYSYICCAERQGTTQDIHFHYLCFSREKLFSSAGSKGEHCIQEITKLAKLYEVSPHPSLYDIKEITDFSGVVSYSSKCFGNHNVKGKQGYCSLFECRTFSASRSVSRFFKENADMWLRRLSEDQVLANPDLFVQVREEQFFRVYEFSDKLWNLANDSIGENSCLPNYSRLFGSKGIYSPLSEKVNRLTLLKIAPRIIN